MVERLSVNSNWGQGVSTGSDRVAAFARIRDLQELLPGRYRSGIDLIRLESVR